MPTSERVEDPGHVVHGRVADALGIAIVETVRLEQQDEHRQRDEPPEELAQRATGREIRCCETDRAQDPGDVGGDQQTS